MNENDAALNKIKQLEAELKKMILKSYGKFLPEDRISLLNISNYASVAMLGYESMDEVRGELLRRMLDDAIDSRTIKEVSLADGNKLTINYGYRLEDALINYYSNQLAQKYNFNIDEVEGLSDDLDTIKLLYEKLGDSFDASAFNDDAVKLLEKADVKEIIEKYDQEELESYFNNLSKVAGISQASKQEQNNMIKNSVDRINSIQIVWLHDKKHIKYVDPYGEVHLTDISHTPSVEEFYKEKMANLGPGEKIDPEKFHRELQTYYADEMQLLSTSDVEKDKLNSKQVNMLEFLKSNKELQVLQEQGIMRHNSEMNIHVMTANNDIVTTEDKEGHVEASIVSNGNAQIDSQVVQNGNDISNNVISKEEYIRLSNKLLNEEELSKEELEALRRATPIYAQDVYNDMMQQRPDEEKGAVLKPKDNYNSGFTVKTFAIYFVVLSLLLATIIAIILLR